MNQLLALLPAALCTRLVRRAPRPERSAQVPVLYAGRPDLPQPAGLITEAWHRTPTRQP